MLLPRDLNLPGELAADTRKQLNAAVTSCGSVWRGYRTPFEFEMNFASEFD